MPGFTAWAGLTQIGVPKPGEVVCVAAATGPVGATVGQIAKLLGCHVVGIAGGPDKCRHAVDKLGFDACIPMWCRFWCRTCWWQMAGFIPRQWILRRMSWSMVDWSPAKTLPRQRQRQRLC